MTSRPVPPQPGAVLRHEVLELGRIKPVDLARAMGVSTVRLYQILNGKASITPNTALRLGHATNTTPEFWLAVQSKYALFQAKKRLAGVLEKLPKLVIEQGMAERAAG